MRPVRCPRPIKLDSFALELDIGPSNGMENPTETLTKIPPAFAVVDSKSLYAVPSCSEYRTLLEALVIKDRLREGIEFKGVHGAAQMADALTKDMQTWKMPAQRCERSPKAALGQTSETSMDSVGSPAAPSSSQVCQECLGSNHP